MPDFWNLLNTDGGILTVAVFSILAVAFVINSMIHAYVEVRTYEAEQDSIPQGNIFGLNNSISEISSLDTPLVDASALVDHMTQSEWRRELLKYTQWLINMDRLVLSTNEFTTRKDDELVDQYLEEWNNG